jgi:hypothetical protein
MHSDPNYVLRNSVSPSSHLRFYVQNCRINPDTISLVPRLSYNYLLQLLIIIAGVLHTPLLHFHTSYLILFPFQFAFAFISRGLGYTPYLTFTFTFTLISCSSVQVRNRHNTLDLASGIRSVGVGSWRFTPFFSLFDWTFAFFLLSYHYSPLTYIPRRARPG